MSKEEKEVIQTQEETPEKTDVTPEVKPTEEEKIESLEDGFSQWSKADKFKEEMEVSDDKPPTETKPDDGKPCSDCDKEGRHPIATLDRKGEKHQIYTEEELHKLASMGLDYTKKTQGIAEEKKTMEQQFQEKIDQVTSIVNRIEQQKNAPVQQTEDVKQPQTKEERKAQIFKLYDIDPEFAEPGQMKQAEDMMLLKDGMGFLLRENQDLKRGFENKEKEGQASDLGNIITKARENFPFEEITDENGNSQTMAQIISLILAKSQMLQSTRANGKITVDEIGSIAEDSVKALHFAQLGSKQAGNTALTNDMSVEDVQSKFPDLFQKILEKGSDEGVAQHLKDLKDGAPTLTGVKREVSTKETKGEITGLEDAFNKAKKDPEILGG